MWRAVPPTPSTITPATASAGPAAFAAPNSIQLSAMIPKWSLPPNVLTHWGKPFASDAVFFVAPPHEIGEVISADTNVRAGQHPRPAGLRAAIAFIAALPGLCIISLAVINAQGEALGIGLSLGTLLALTCAPIAWLLSISHAHCSYVGRLGAVRFRYRGKKKPPKAEAIIFDQAAELHTPAVRHFNHGVYTGTDYGFIWIDASGRRVCDFSGRHHGEDGLPKPGNPVYFAYCAELAWSEYLLDRAADELARTGALTFKITADYIVRVGPGFIEFQWGGEPERFEAADIGRLSLDTGIFRIHHKDARWHSTAGKYSFEYGDMPNARLFLLALDRFIRTSK